MKKDWGAFIRGGAFNREYTVYTFICIFYSYWLYPTIPHYHYHTKFLLSTSPRWLGICILCKQWEVTMPYKTKYLLSYHYQSEMVKISDQNILFIFIAYTNFMKRWQILKSHKLPITLHWNKNKLWMKFTLTLISNAPWIYLAISRRNIIRLLRNSPVIQIRVFYVILCVF